MHSAFSQQVWAGVIGRKGGRPEDNIAWHSLEPLLRATQGTALDALKQHQWSPEPRPSGRRPIPLQFLHDASPTSAELDDRLLKALDLFDVWGIIASGSAGDVSPLRHALAGIDIPLLVTTDSTTVPASGQRPNELRLMPSNKAQATAMLFAATRVITQQPTKADTILRQLPSIAYSFEDTPQARDYVKDLRTHLTDEAKRLDIRFTRFNGKRDHVGPLIGIGYEEHAYKLIGERTKGRVTILSDGCATPKVRDAVLERRRDDVHHWFVTRPAVTLGAIGSKSFEAIAEAGHKVLTARRASAHDTHFRVSLRDSIRQILSESDDVSFNFDGIENVAAAYRVVPISQEDDLPPATRLPDGGTDSGPSAPQDVVVNLANRRKTS
jgi:hypothetical protein